MSQRLRSPLWLAVRLPHIALECLIAAAQEPPPASALCVNYKQRVYLANAAALALGVQQKTPISQAQALAAEIVFLSRDEALEQRTLQHLLTVLYAFSPHLKVHRIAHASHGEYSIVLEISRCLSLFGGLAPFCQRLEQQLQASRFTYVLALAHSQEAAWLLTWNPPAQMATEAEACRKQLWPLSIRYFIEYPKIVEQLASMGFNTLGDLWLQIQSPSGYSFAALQKRFGKAFTQYLKALLALDSSARDALPMHTPKADFIDSIEFDYPVANVEQLLPACQALLQQLSDFLRNQQQQTQSIQWRLLDIKKNQHTIAVRTQNPLSHWPLLLELSAIQFHHQDLPFAVDCLELRCQHSSPIAVEPLDLFQFTDNHGSQDEREKLIAKLDARLGDGGLFQLRPLSEHLPEQTQTTIPPHNRITAASQNTDKLRPTWLFVKPQAIKIKNTQLFWHGYLTLLQGPERITGKWWQTPEERDYFIALRGDCVRCWIYRERMAKQWYVQGIFA